ncbi:MAG: phosphoribosylaminoimidazolesuccinocarboxamide synthase [Phycisphaerales bacterium]
MTESPLFASNLNLPGRRQGKVRDVYELPGDRGDPRLLIVATDRISAFDVVMPTPVPGKGKLLTEIASWWFGFIERQGLARTHLISTRVDDIPAAAFAGEGTTRAELLRGRVTIARACRVVPIECVVRGYLEGSGWADYQTTGAVCGVALPKGLRRCERLPSPIFTPATKAAEGHDENVSFEAAAAAVGGGLLERLRDMSLAIYGAAAEHALARGIIIADTKFEFGLDDRGEPVLIDEALTPDSSRFWPVDQYEPGRAQPSFDKQFLREYLQGLVDAGRWRKEPPGPALPDRIVEQTLSRYREAKERLCG